MKILVRVKPNSHYEKIELLADNTYLISVKEPPIENKANQAVIRVLADYFCIPKSKITIVAGQKSRRKVIELNN